MPELRKDPILDRWVIIAAERGRRPSDFPVEPDAPASGFSPFAPGNESKTPPEVFQIGRSADAPADSSGWRVRVVPNKYPALSNEGLLDYQGLGMFDMMNGVGAHEVIIEHTREDWDMADATPEEMCDILQAYVARIHDLQRDERFRYVLIFRNIGTAAGASIAHPHSQVMALPIIPQLVEEKLTAAREYYDRKHRCIFEDIIRQEMAMGDRVVETNEHFVVLSPFAARFPFELQLYPRRHSHDFGTIRTDEMSALGDILTRSLRRIKRTLNNPAYNLIVHTAPTQPTKLSRSNRWDTIAEDYLWHIEILPRLTSVAGFEWGTGFYINPVAPELATQYLKETEI
jgi:UDPglucose--hexose-1-phosphate uridylyltransferase